MLHFTGGRLLPPRCGFCGGLRWCEIGAKAVHPQTYIHFALIPKNPNAKSKSRSKSKRKSKSKSKFYFDFDFNFDFDFDFAIDVNKLSRKYICGFRIFKESFTPQTWF